MCQHMAHLMHTENIMGQKHQIVLVVESDILLANTLKTVIESYGYVVFLAANGDEAIKKLKILGEQHKPCLVLTNLIMPISSGWDLIKIMDNSPALAAIPVILMEFPYSIDRPLPHHKAFLKKPYSLDSILDAIHSACENKPKTERDSQGLK